MPWQVPFKSSGNESVWGGGWGDQEEGAQASGDWLFKTGSDAPWPTLRSPCAEERCGLGIQVALCVLVGPQGASVSVTALALRQTAL